MSKKHLSEINYFEDYQMLAIVSHLKDYTLCYHINNALNVDLIKYTDLIPPYISNDKLAFSWYFFIDDISKTSYYLIANKCSNGRLLPSQKTIDYFFIIKSPVDELITKNIATKLRNISNVTAALSVDMQRQKNLDLIIEAIELHESEVVNRNNPYS